MSTVQERYRPMLMAANATAVVKGEQVAGFLCKTTGTISVTTNGGILTVDAVPVTAGIYTPLPFFLGINGGTVTLASGASGTLAVS